MFVENFVEISDTNLSDDNYLCESYVPVKKQKQKNVKKVTHYRTNLKCQPLKTIHQKAFPKGYTLINARNTVDGITKKLRRFKHGFEIPASIGKKSNNGD